MKPRPVQDPWEIDVLLCVKKNRVEEFKNMVPIYSLFNPRIFVSVSNHFSYDETGCSSLTYSMFESEIVQVNHWWLNTSDSIWPKYQYMELKIRVKTNKTFNLTFPYL